MLRQLEVTGEASVSSEKDMHSLCSADCHNIVLAMANYDGPAQEQFFACSIMAMTRLGKKPDEIRMFFETIMEKVEKICGKQPFPCQMKPAEAMVYERNFYEVFAACQP